MQFDWEEEINEILSEKYIKSYEIIESKSPTHKNIKITSLEGNVFDLDCSVANGIKVVYPANNFPTFECFEQLLNKISPLYQKKFFEDINEAFENQA